MNDWKLWSEQKPEPGMKIVVACNDGCSSALAYVTKDGTLHAEDGYDLGSSFMSGSLWTEIPSDYPIAFMEITEDDWR